MITIEELINASRVSYDPNGSSLIYVTESPFVRNTDTILPGVDITASSRTGRGTLIAPDIIATAFHIRNNLINNGSIVNLSLIHI